MKMLPLAYILILFMVRRAAAYDPKQLVQGYLVIPHPTLAEILISQSDPLTGRSKNRKENRNKMSFLGVGLYIFSMLMFLLHVVFFFKKPIGTAEYTIDSRFIFLHASNLNEVIIILSILIVLPITIATYFINSLILVIRKPKVSGRKLAIFLYSAFIFMFLALAVSKLIELLRLIGEF